MLDPIHNQGLRLALGAFRTSVASLYVAESSLYAIRLAANPSNPAHEVSFPPKYVDLYKKKPKSNKLIIWHLENSTLRICQYQT